MALTNQAVQNHSMTTRDKPEMLSDFSSGYFMPEVQQPNHQVNKTVAVGIQHSITYNISDIRAPSHMSWSENSSTCMY